MTVWTSVLWKVNIQLTGKWPEVVAKLLFTIVIRFDSDYILEWTAAEFCKTIWIDLEDFWFLLYLAFWHRRGRKILKRSCIFKIIWPYCGIRPLQTFATVWVPLCSSILMYLDFHNFPWCIWITMLQELKKDVSWKHRFFLVNKNICSEIIWTHCVRSHLTTVEILEVFQSHLISTIEEFLEIPQKGFEPRKFAQKSI